jgi:hypothetical protein
MAKSVFGIITVLLLCSASLAQDADYYTAIQKRSSTKVKPAQFKQIEENALKDFPRPGAPDVKSGRRIWVPHVSGLHVGLRFSVAD